MCQVGLYFLKWVFFLLCPFRFNECWTPQGCISQISQCPTCTVRCTDLNFRYSMCFILILAYDTCCVVWKKLGLFLFVSYIILRIMVTADIFSIHYPWLLDASRFRGQEPRGHGQAWGPCFYSAKFWEDVFQFDKYPSKWVEITLGWFVDLNRFDLCCLWMYFFFLNGTVLFSSCATGRLVGNILEFEES